MKKFIIVLSLVMVLVLGMAIVINAEDETEAAEPVETTVETEVGSGAVDEKPADGEKTDVEKILDAIQSEEPVSELKQYVDKFLASAIAFLSANLVSIIIFIVKYLKLKSQELNVRKAYDEKVDELTKKYNDKLEQFSNDMSSKLDALDNHVLGHITDVEDLRKLEIKQNTVELKDTIAAIKDSLKM